MTRRLVMLALISSSAFAHEAWLSVVDGGVTMRIGEDFDGDEKNFKREKIESLQFDAKELQWPTPDAGEVTRLVIPRGTTLISYSGRPSTITLAGPEFTAYLKEDGHELALAMRADAGTSQTPGRERYARTMKSVLGPVTAHSKPIGQTLELIAVTPSSFELRFEGKPLPGALVRAWHRRAGQVVQIKTLTDSRGVATFDLPFTGAWMISSVHMRPLSGVPNLDWDSTWTSLTFTR